MLKIFPGGAAAGSASHLDPIAFRGDETFLSATKYFGPTGISMPLACRKLGRQTVVRLDLCGEAPGTAFAHSRRTEVLMPGVASAFKTPSSLRAEHEELHTEIASAAKLHGRLGEAASAVAQAL